MILRESVELGGRAFQIEVGRVARQADGAVFVQFGDTVVLATACAADHPREGIDFFPLTCDYQEKTFAAGKIPGGFFKREGRPRDEETLTSRLIDRPLRPLFPDGFRCETQVIASVYSADKVNPSDVLAVTGASTALHISDIPWQGPIAAVRVGRVDGAFIANPTFAEIEKSDVDIIVVSTREAIAMVEGSAAGVPEDVLIDALLFAQTAAQPLLDLQEKLRAAIGKPKRAFEPKKRDADVAARVEALALADLRAALAIGEKQARYAKLDEVKKKAATALAAEFPDRDKEIKGAYEELKKHVVRAAVVGEARRIDGRGLTDIRQVTCEVGVLPRTHGSALFTRGETQALVTATLGTSQDEQKIDGLIGERWKRFLFHYNFPPFSTGEVKFLRGASRREIGHGALAERSLARFLPPKEEFPYTVRIVSEILESNGSSSMASVCGASLALMDAGVPIKSPVAGIAMGLIQEGERIAVLTDILGDEDHLGDMDFKVCGTREGVTAIQMDTKVKGLDRSILQKALYQARDARLFILDRMLATLAEPRADLSQYAPRITTIKVKPDLIRNIIGPGGKTIRGIVDQTGVTIDVEDDGTVFIASADAAAVAKAIQIVKDLTAQPDVGATYSGVVRRIADFGAFVEILPGIDGLVHISELAFTRVERVEDICKEGDTMQVKVINIDREGKVRLSRRELLPKPEGWDEQQAARGPAGGGDRGGRDRGPRGRGGPGGGRGGGGRGFGGPR